MKKILFALFILASVVLFAGDSKKEIARKLYGRIQIVDSFPDYEVRIVEVGGDLNVKIVDSFADSPGKWKIVNDLPDYKVRIVDHFPDIEIKIVDAFPGVPFD